MKKFAFHLETLMSLREQEEEKARLHLGEITSLCNQLDMKLEVLAQERTRALHTSTGQNIGTELFLQSRYTLRIDHAIEDILDQRSKAEIQREQAVLQYQAAHKNVEILHRLREKKFNEYKKLILKDEQRGIDDLAGARYLQNEESFTT